MGSLAEEYRELMAKVRDIILLSSVKGLLLWDTDTYMPPGSVAQRSDQFELVQGIIHDWQTSPRIGELLHQLGAATDASRLNSQERRNVHLVQRQYSRLTKVPLSLVRALAKQKTLADHVWKQAKRSNDFGAFRPALEKVVDLTKQKAAAIDPNKDPLDVLVDLYEPGVTTRQIAPLFETLKLGMRQLVDRYSTPAKSQEFDFLHRAVPLDVQRALGRELCEFLGYDFTYGRVDEVEHPFSVGMYEDLRTCTHYHESRPLSGLFALLHECGHALYEFNLPPAHRWTPLGTSVSLGIHESQSRFVENVVGRSPEFWEWFYPRLRARTGRTFEDIPREALVRAVNAVCPTLIRIDADEVTYNLHVILRFEIERMLLHDAASVAELPQIWNDKMEEYLGIRPPTDAEGVLQDVHWAGGSFGYFPTYVLGNLYGGMFRVSLDQDVPNWRVEIAHGNFIPTKVWFASHIWQRGNVLDPFDLVKEVTGNSSSVEPFMLYVKKKCELL